MLPYLLDHSIIFQGKPGIGKTQAAEIIALAVARFHARRCDSKASFRSTSSLDTLRGIRGSVMQSLITDDLSLAKETVDKLLAFADVGQEEAHTVERWENVHMVRGQLRIMCDNPIDETNEPTHSQSIVTHEEFWNIARIAYPRKVDDTKIMALWKRSAIILNTSKYVYLRLPTQHEVPVPRFFGITDYLKGTHKRYLSLYKKGKHFYYDDFETNLQWEQKLLDYVLAPLLNADEKCTQVGDFHESSESDIELSSQGSIYSHMKCSKGVMVKTATTLTTHQNAQHISNTVFNHLEQKIQADEKYMVQIKNAHELLSECVQSEMILTQVIKTNENLFNNLLGFADGGLSREIDRQEQDRLSAIEIMQILNHFVQENVMILSFKNTTHTSENHAHSSTETISTAPTIAYDETFTSSSSHDVRDEPASPIPTREWKLIEGNDFIDIDTSSPMSKKYRVDSDDYEEMDLTQELRQALSEATLECEDYD